MSHSDRLSFGTEIPATLEQDIDLCKVSVYGRRADPKLQKIIKDLKKTSKLGESHHIDISMTHILFLGWQAFLGRPTAMSCPDVSCS